MFPALGDSASTYVDVLPALHDALGGAVRIIAVDPPGYGRSIRPGGAIPSFSTLFAWAGRLCADVNAVIAVGNSSGGAMATAAAVSLHDRVRGLALIAWPDWRVATLPVARLVPTDIDEMTRLLAHSWHEPPQIASQMAEIVLQRYQNPAFRVHVHSLDPEEVQRLYERYRGPLLFVGGESDRLVPVDALERSASRRSDARLHVIPACGHFPHKERPLALVDVLVDFVHSLDDNSMR